MTHIAICFFGITRSLRYTIGSIEQNVLGPARARGRVTVHAHLYRQTEIVNPRSGENGRLDPDEHALLRPDQLELEDPDLCLGPMGFEALKTHGDAWYDDFRSLRNLVHQLHSLDRVTTMAQESGAGTVIFVRPDLMYHDSMAYALRSALRSKRPSVWVPSWQRFSGANDRFAIAHGDRAIAAYGQRGRFALEYCETESKPLHAEQLLSYVLMRQGVIEKDIDVRATRIRVGGVPSSEDVFPSSPWDFIGKFARRTGLKSILRYLKRQLLDALRQFEKRKG